MAQAQKNENSAVFDAVKAEKEAQFNELYEKITRQAPIAIDAFHSRYTNQFDAEDAIDEIYDWVRLGEFEKDEITFLYNDNVLAHFEARGKRYTYMDKFLRLSDEEMAERVEKDIRSHQWDCVLDQIVGND